MQEKELKELLSRYRLGEATEEEKALIESWYLQYQEKDWAEYTLPQRMEDVESIWSDLVLVRKYSRIRSLTIRIAAAASIILTLSFGIYYYLNITPVQQITQNKTKIYDVAPGSNKAILTLANGRRIALDKLKAGIIAIESNVIIKKAASGELVYISSGSDFTSNQNKLYNNISVPKGSEFQVILSDGSHVWLNSQSTIKLPLNFTGDERKVKITGEAYFEVAKNPLKPFNVNVDDREQIRVLGTHFNVTAYNEDNVILTTLAEGSVKLTKGKISTILKPGQQGVLKNSQSLFEIRKVNPDDFVAWKNGLFVFNYENITGIMKKISRWYNVDIVFKGNMNNINFVGNYSKYKSLSKLLKYIELSNRVHFIIEERRVTIIAN